jgi:putative PEP-CTERM system histidine kinase
MRQSDGVKIHISRHVAYRSVVLLAVAFYLIGLGLVGEGMRYFGESFPRSLVVALSLVVGIGIVTILLSETVKRKITAFLNRNFYQDKYDYRVQWLDFTDRLSSARTGDELLTGILSGYCETFGMGGGALFLSDNARDGYSLAAKLEMEPACPRVGGSDPFIGCMLTRKHVVNRVERTGEPVLAQNEFLNKNEVSLAVPLYLNGLMHGFILLVRPLNSKETYSTEDYDLMKTLAHQTSSAILNLRLSDQLAQAKEMEVLGRVSTFVVHDLKNLVYTVSLILDNAKEYIAEPDFQQDMLASLGNTVDKMKTLIAKLKYMPEKGGLTKQPVDLLRLMEEIAATVTGAGVRVSGSPVIAEVDRDEMHKVALNLLLNAVDATEGRGTVSVEVGRGEQAFIRVSDDGCGIPEGFLRRDLFSPFKSTKKSGLGIGLYQCKQIVEAHNGTIEVESEVGKGSVFTVRIPAEQV